MYFETGLGSTSLVEGSSSGMTVNSICVHIEYCRG